MIKIIINDLQNLTVIHSSGIYECLYKPSWAKAEENLKEQDSENNKVGTWS